MIWGTPTRVIDVCNVTHHSYFCCLREETKLIINAHSLQQIFVKTIFFIPFCIFILKNLVVSEIIHNFANESQPSWKPMGQRGGQDTYINKKAYLALWFWRVRTSQLQLLVKNKATETPHGVYYIHSSHSPLHLFAKELMIGTIYTHTWGFQRCSFRLTGQCEGLNTWNEWQDWLHVFFICMQSSFKITRQEGAIGKNVFLFMKTTFTL